MVDSDQVSQKWLVARQEIVSRVFLVPSKDDLQVASDEANLKSEIDQQMLLNISQKSGQTLNAHGITNLLIESYNQIVQDNKFDELRISILIVTLDLFSNLIVIDKDVTRMIRENIYHAIDMTSLRQNAVQTP